MKYIDWDPNYSTNIYIIDNQHKKIISSYNNILDHFFEDRLITDIKYFIKYIQYHFDLEEKIYKLFEIPYKHHKQKQDNFIIHLEYVYRNLKQTPFPIEELEIIEKWISTHIIIDNRYMFHLLKINKLTPKNILLLNFNLYFHFYKLKIFKKKYFVHNYLT